MATTTAKVIFNIPLKLKQAAKKRAIKEGFTLTEVLNASIRAFVEGDVTLMHPELQASASAIARFEQIRASSQKQENVSPAFKDTKDLLGWIESE